MQIEEAINKLEKIREEKNMSKQKFAGIELDIPYQTYMRWLNGTNTPSGDNLAKIYEYISTNTVKKVEEKFNEADEINHVELGFSIKKDVHAKLQKLKKESSEDIDSQVSNRIREAVENFVREKMEE